MLEALALVGLERRIGALQAGLDTPLSSSGWPLSVAETMALKLAGAILARPRVLVLSPLYDLLPPATIDRVLARLRGEGTTVLQFTARPEGLKRDAWLWLGETRQHRGASVDEVLPPNIMDREA